METAQSYGNYGLTVLTKWMLQCSCSSSGMASTSSSSCCVKFSMGSSMGEAAMSISSAGEVWIADASGEGMLWETPMSQVPSRKKLWEMVAWRSQRY